MKLVKIGLVAGMLFSMSACGNTSEETTTINCKMGNSYNVMDVESNVKIYFDEEKALNSIATETITFYESEDMTEEELTAFIEELVTTYQTQKEELEEPGTTFDFEVDEMAITLTTKVNYNQINIDEFLKEKPEGESLIEDDYFSISKVKKSYESGGYVCTDLQ